MKHFLFVFFISILAVCVPFEQVRAKSTKVEKPMMSIESLLEDLKKYPHLEAYYREMSARHQSSKLNEDYKYWQSQGVELNKILPHDLLAKKNRLFLPQIEAPFIFAEDMSFVKYKEIPIRIPESSSAKDFHGELKSKWSQFPELEFDSKKSKEHVHFLFPKLFIFQFAHAQNSPSWFSGVVSSILGTFVRAHPLSGAGSAVDAEIQRMMNQMESSNWINLTVNCHLVRNPQTQRSENQLSFIARRSNGERQNVNATIEKALERVNSEEFQSFKNDCTAGRGNYPIIISNLASLRRAGQLSGPLLWSEIQKLRQVNLGVNPVTAPRGTVPGRTLSTPGATQ